jgi:hypothetical protein
VSAQHTVCTLPLTHTHYSCGQAASNQMFHAAATHRASNDERQMERERA